MTVPSVNSSVTVRNIGQQAHVEQHQMLAAGCEFDAADRRRPRAAIELAHTHHIPLEVR